MEFDAFEQFLIAHEQSLRNPPRNQKTCTLCKMPPHATQFHCTVCLDAKYCSNECLETDEDAHSLVCPTFSPTPRKLLPDERGTRLFRAVIFEADRNAPRFEWVVVRGDNPVGLIDHLGSPPVEVKFPSLCLKWRHNTVRDRDLPDMVKVYINSNLEENRGIRRIIEMSRWWLEAEANDPNCPRFTANEPDEAPEDLSQELVKCYCKRPDGQCPETVDFKGAQMHPWKGTVAFMIQQEHTDGPSTFRDIDSTDFRDIVDFLSVCKGHEVGDVGLELARSRAHKLQVVLVYTGYEHRNGEGRKVLYFGEYTLPQDHPILRTHGTSESLSTKLKISIYIEIPMFAVSPNNYLRWPPREIYDVPEPISLNWRMLIIRQFIDPPDNRIDLDTDESINLWEAGYDNDTHISVVLFREDQKLLREEDIDALYMWISDEITADMIANGLDPYTNWDDIDFPMNWSHARFAQKARKDWFENFWHKREQILLNAPHLLKCGQRFEGYERIDCPYHVKCRKLVPGVDPWY